ncbi:MAG: hypothetical protein AAB666_00005, partial [Patescibacteria group bacterium]
ALAPNCREFKREEGQIEWRRAAIEIYNQWRAFQPWPGVFTNATFGEKKMKIKILKMLSPAIQDVIVSDMPTNRQEARNPSPFIKLNKKSLGTVAGDGQIILIDELQPEGKKAMNAEAFINGYLR